MTRSCGVPSRVGGMDLTSSETLIANAKAELEEERKVGTGLTEFRSKKKPQLWPCGQSPSTLQHWQPQPLVWFSSQPGIWRSLFLTL